LKAFFYLEKLFQKGIEIASQDSYGEFHGQNVPK